MGNNRTDKVAVISAAAEIANSIGLNGLTLKAVANRLKCKSPSLYNHIEGLDELKSELMLMGWREIGRKVTAAAAGYSGSDALKNMCRAFKDYALENSGVFEAMLWYNKYADSRAMAATEDMFSLIYRVFADMGVNRQMSDHLIRTLRSFLEGFVLLVNNGAFGAEIDIDESFEKSLDVILAGINYLKTEE